MRDADQIGTIMAGAWLIDHDKAPTASEAKTWLESLISLTSRVTSSRRLTRSNAYELLNNRIDAKAAVQKLFVGVLELLLVRHREKPPEPER